MRIGVTLIAAMWFALAAPAGAVDDGYWPVSKLMRAIDRAPVSVQGRSVRVDTETTLCTGRRDSRRIRGVRGTHRRRKPHDRSLRRAHFRHIRPRGRRRSEADDTFWWEHDKGSVSIASRDKDAQPPYQLAIFNPERVRVEELSSTLLEDDAPAPWNEALADLYRAARRSALHADDVIEALIGALPSRPENAPMSRSVFGDSSS